MPHSGASAPIVSGLSTVDGTTRFFSSLGSWSLTTNQRQSVPCCACVLPARGRCPIQYDCNPQRATREHHVCTVQIGVENKSKVSSACRRRSTTVGTTCPASRLFLRAVQVCQRCSLSSPLHQRLDLCPVSQDLCRTPACSGRIHGETLGFPDLESYVHTLRRDSMSERPICDTRQPVGLLVLPTTSQDEETKKTHSPSTTVPPVVVRINNASHV